MVKRIEGIEEETIHDGLEQMANPMDHTQYKILIGHIKSVIRLLIYILAALFGGLCYAIGKFEHLSGFWLFIYPAIFIFLVFSEIHVVRKNLGKSRQDGSKNSNHSSGPGQRTKRNPPTRRLR